MDIIKKVKELDFPFGEYVIIGGGILEALGIRDTNDIDVVVTPNLLKKLRESGKYKEEIKWGKLFLLGDKIEIGDKLNWDNYSTEISEAIKTATIIDGVPFLNIEETIKFKTALGREKDFKDIILIEKYLNKGIAVEKLMDYICKKYGLLLHGSIHEIKHGKIKSNYNKIFATNKGVIAIERSLYSNVGVNLQYPYFISKENPFVLKIHTKDDRKFIKKDKGFVYVLKNDGFKNDPKGSWQFVKESSEVDFVAVIETKDKDFTYPVEIFNDFDLKERNKK